MDYGYLLTVGGVVLFLLVCLTLILTVLIQRPQGGGLSGAFGAGAGSGQTAFGAKTGDALTIATIGMFVAFLILAVVLNFAVRPGPARTGGSQGASITDPADAVDEDGAAGAGAVNSDAETPDPSTQADGNADDAEAEASSETPAEPIEAPGGP
ncbi:MAG: preprotein translocase subunit SecG [Phycisphaerae bacterium]|nr:preprotein translocase subunit SecG [Phycisphaerae bacterium]